MPIGLCEEVESEARKMNLAAVLLMLRPVFVRTGLFNAVGSLMKADRDKKDAAKCPNCLQRKVLDSKKCDLA